MKKLLFTLTFVLAAMTAAAQTFTVGNLNYKIIDANARTVAIAKGMDITGDVVLPSTVTYENVAYTVTQVLGYAFSESGITGVTIPVSIDSIGERAFGSCASLAKVTINDSEKVLKLRNGYYGSFAYSDAEKTVYVGRDIWRNDNNNVFGNATSVKFGDKVTFINSKMFSDHSKLATITIGKGVKTIKANAFSNTGNDENIEEQVVIMGSSVTLIEGSAFESCAHLKSITLPETLTNIDGYAFSSTGLTAITIPVSVDSIGNRAFGSCGSLAKVTINDSEKVLKLRNGYYGTFNYSDAEKTIYVGRDIWRNDNDIVFVNATSVKFGDKVTVINRQMFQNHTNLATITIGKGVKTIEAYAFSNTGTAETIDEQVVTMGSNVTLIEGSAFDGCSHLKKITLPETLKNIDGYAFGSTGLTAITIPVSVDSIGDRAFGSCGDLASIHINDSQNALKLKNGHYGTFAYSDGDKTVYVGRDIWRNGNDAVFGANATSVEFSDNVTLINNRMFNGQTKLASITIGKGVKTIEEYAFNNTGNAEEIDEQVVTMGSSVEFIGDCAFQSCKKLKTITLPETLKNINGYAFSETGLTAITIPVSVDSIGDRAFGSCGALASIHINDSQKELKLRNGYYGTFAYSDGDKTVYVGRDIWRNGNDAVFGANATSVEFSDNVTLINNRMFNGQTKLASITIGKGVKTIEEYAFNNTGNAEEIDEQVVTMGSSVEFIGDCAFQSCKKLKTITLPETLKNINGYAFSETGLTAITIPAMVDSIGDRAFGSCGSLAAIRIPDGNKTLKIRTGYYGTFAYSGAEKTVYVGRNIWRNNNDAAFSNVTGVEFGPTMTNIATYLLAGNTALANVKAKWLQPFDIEDNVFAKEIYSTATLWIPNGTMENYKLTNGWKNFLNMDYAYFFVSLQANKGGTITAGGLTASNSSARDLFDRETDVAVTIKANDGYRLQSLTVNGTAVQPVNGVYTISNLQADQAVVATFAPINYTISYNLAGGSLPADKTNPATYTIESNAITLVNPVRAGYTFEGWTGTDLENPTKTVTIAKGSMGNRSYTATWKVINYTISYDLAGGALPQNQTNPTTYTVESNAITLVNPTRTGYTFEGWTGTDLENPTKTVTIAKGSTGNRSYKATWKAIEYTISYDLAGGVLPQNLTNPATYTVESNAITLINPVREGYEFTGWTGTDLLEPTLAVTIAKGSMGNRSYTATWKILEACDVNGDGTVDVADIATIIDVMAGSAQEYKDAADVNNDNVVDVADIATVIDRMAELARLQRQIEE